jgi:hypothetical protein
VAKGAGERGTPRGALTVSSGRCLRVFALALAAGLAGLAIPVVIDEILIPRDEAPVGAGYRRALPQPDGNVIGQQVSRIFIS